MVSIHFYIDDCPQWQCPHVSVHDRIEGIMCTLCEPCNCEGEQA